MCSINFDLIVLSKVSDYEQYRILNVANGAQVLVLDGFTVPTEFLSLVAERLSGHVAKSLATH
jgi:hypothetical protein